MGVMTIRQHLRKRFWAVFGTTILLWVLLTVGGIGMWKMHLLTVGLIFVFLFIFVGGFIACLLTFKCPRCNASLASLIGHFGPLSVFSRKVAHCPFCGVHLDDAQQAVPADVARPAGERRG
ncbi:MAG TPA: hypothetical protein VM240_06795 [Verrucomicrobiae bacterium]|nr:hypothetical protein [Verrucomicrobiae bacterium]